jgi:hypothetical protein
VFLTDTEVAGRLELSGDAPDHNVVMARARIAHARRVVCAAMPAPRLALGANPWRGSSESLRIMAELG